MEDVKLNPPATVSDIKETESILGFKFPSDFKEFYLAANGFEDWDMQENNFSFWPLNRIIEEHNKADNKSFIGFSDWLIRCNAIGFIKESSGIYKDHQIDIGSRPIQSGVIVTSKDAFGKSKEYLNVIDIIAETFKEIVFMINIGTGDIY
ncbi:SMI1/KNR4 family protein [Inquilinus sp. KBS0705]|nr:SMI1/KNR4 family protein [Inquilinus sp. KBS0705]